MELSEYLASHSKITNARTKAQEAATEKYLAAVAAVKDEYEAAIASAQNTALKEADAINAAWDKARADEVAEITKKANASAGLKPDGKPLPDQAKARRT